MAANHHPEAESSNRFPVDLARPVEIVVHNRTGAITVKGVNRQDILLRSDAADDGDLHDVFQIEFENNRLEIRTESHGRHASKAVRDARREATRAAKEASRATRDIFRRREGQFGKGPVIGSWQIDFDEHIKNELRGLLPFRGGGGSYDLEIEVPASGVEVRVEAHTATGDVRVDDVHGAVDVATASGEIILRRVSGDLTVQTASGEIAISEPAGSLRARSASGDLLVRDGSLEQYVVTTASGDIAIAATLIGAGPYRIDAVSGDVDLRLDAPDHILARGFSLTFKSVSGDGRVSGMQKVNRGLWRYGPDGDGGIEMPIHTVSGDISVALSRQGPGTPPPTRPDDATIPLPPSPPPPPRPPHPPTIVADMMAPAPPGTTHAEPAEPAEPAQLAEPAEPAAAASLESERHTDALTRIADEMAASLAEPPVATYSYPPAPAQDRLTILAALEQGDIDIDEAMRRLDSLPPTP